MSFLNTISRLSGKVRQFGTHYSGKVRTTFKNYSGKVRHFLHDVRSLNKKVNEYAPIVALVADELTDLVPGISQAKTIGKVGLSAFNAISSLSERVDDKLGKAERFSDTPSLQTFNNLFGN